MIGYVKCLTLTPLLLIRLHMILSTLPRNPVRIAMIRATSFLSDSSFFLSLFFSLMTDTTYSEILKVWNSETPDDFAIFSELYYQMFGGEYDVPYTTESTTSSFFPYN